MTLGITILDMHPREITKSFLDSLDSEDRFIAIQKRQVWLKDVRLRDSRFERLCRDRLLRFKCIWGSRVRTYCCSYATHCYILYHSYFNTDGELKEKFESSIHWKALLKSTGGDNDD